MLGLTRTVSALSALALLSACSEAPEDFARPTGVAFASNGDAYVADGYDHARIARFDPNGCFTSSFGEHGVGKGQFETPHGIVIDVNDRIYVADRDNARVQVFDSDGHFLASWSAPELGHPWAVALGPDGHVYVADGGNQTPGGTARRIVELDSNGNTLGVFGHDAALESPHGIAVGGDNSVYVADLDGRSLRKFVRR
ncbi:MAG: 6-bladed beta-propeller [Myxococcota bacterium]